MTTLATDLSTPDLRRLAAPFARGDIEWRVQTTGEKNGQPWARVLAYVTARAVMARLDDVLGVDGWQVSYAPGPVGGVMAMLSIRVHRDDGTTEWITKADGAAATDVEGIKGGYSAALKRAAVALGIGRYLYRLDEGWAQVNDRGQFSARTKEGRWFRWDPPALPAWALPAGDAGGQEHGRDGSRVAATAPVATERTLREIEDTLAQLHIVDPKVAARMRGRVNELTGQIETSEAYAADILAKLRRTVGATPIATVDHAA